MATFSNQAVLSYNDTTTNSNVVVGELVEVLSATKTPVVDRYTTGGRVTYVISIVNAGTTAFTGLTVTDNLGAYSSGGSTLYPLNYTDGSLKYYVNGVLQTPPTVTAGPPLSISGVTVPANGEVTLVYETQANSYAPLGTGSSITNTATVSGGSLTAPLTATAVVYPESSAALTITKSICPAAVTENSRLTYTFTIQNSGNTAAVASDNVFVTDTFDPILSNLTVTLDGVALSTPNEYTYTEATGAFSTVAGRITVPAATYRRNPNTGGWIVTPGVSVLTVTGTV